MKDEEYPEFPDALAALRFVYSNPKGRDERSLVAMYRQMQEEEPMTFLKELRTFEKIWAELKIAIDARREREAGGPGMVEGRDDGDTGTQKCVEKCEALLKLLREEREAKAAKAVK